MKSRNLFKGVLFLAVLFISSEIFAQLDFSGEFRPRTELRNGYKTLPSATDKAAFFTSQRTRLNLYYKNDDFKVGFSLQDVRTWGDTKQLNTTDNHIFIHEAWGQYFFAKEFSIKMGRQELIYDDHRIFGSVNWAQQARSHDVAVFKYHENTLKLDAGFAFNQDKENLFGTNYTLNNYKTFQYLWLHNDFNNFGLSVLLLNNGMQAVEDVIYSQTYGLRLTYKLDDLSLATAFYGQGGKNANDVDLSATYFAAEAMYKVDGGFTFGAGFEHLSGNDSDMIGNANEDKAFTPLYGTNHKFNGHMDYFYVGSHVGNVGLNDLYIALKYNKNKFSMALTTHFFSSDGMIMDGTTEMEKKLGTEADFSLGYKFNKFVSFNFGYSHMFASESMEMLKGGSKDEGSDWAWAMFTFKPNFLNK